MCESMCCLLELGGCMGWLCRPILGFGMNWHVTSISFLIFFMFEHAPTKCSVKCLNGICVWFYEIWFVEQICAYMAAILNVWKVYRRYNKVPKI